MSFFFFFSNLFLYDVKGHLHVSHMLTPFSLFLPCITVFLAIYTSMLTGACARAAQGSPCFAKIWVPVQQVPREGKKNVALKTYENEGRMCLICEILKEGDSVANGRERHSVLPAWSAGDKYTEKWAKAKQITAEGKKKSMGCHGEKERMEERKGLDTLTLCKMFSWLTFVNV